MFSNQLRRQLIAAWISLLFAHCTVHAAPTTTVPAEGLRDNTPAVHALTAARIVVAPGRTIERGTLVLRDGVITAVGAEVAVPKDARVWDMTGKTLYPGLIDAYSEASFGKPPAKKGAPYWNALVRPQYRVAEHYQVDAKRNKKLRGQGITARLAVPAGGVIKGTSALVLTGEGQGQRSILQGRVALHIRLTVSQKPHHDGYPNSPMGAVALARQAMVDTDWYAKAHKAYRADRRLPRPERNDALDELGKYTTDQALTIIDASNELYFLRADRFAREFSLNMAIRGSGHEYRRLEAIRASGRTVIVPLDFPKAPNVGTSEAAMNVTLQELMHWDIAPENAARLDRAGVPIALTSHGLKDKAKFLDAVRTAVRRGLEPEAALRALTATPAKLLGVSDRLGSLQAGMIANVLVTDGDLFYEKTKVLETWVDGRRYETAKAPLIDLRGTWQVTFRDKAGKPLSLVIRLGGKPTKLKGTAGHDETEVKLTHVGLQDARFSCTFKGEKLDRKGIVRLTAVVSTSTDQPPTWMGQIVWPDDTRSPISGRRTGAYDPQQDQEETDNGKKEDGEPEKKPEEKVDRTASYPVNFPLGAFGRERTPLQPAHVLFQNATVWTCEKPGVPEKASVLIGQGKILEVGPNVQAPQGALVIDATGKHITPGIIDCHSHMATDGGINESTQAITAEVRIGDFIDANDIAIYRQLAGGVTASNILHGSANPIGGQNQVIKLRWGALPEQLKFDEAPQGIKFALGENVKQSNWGDKYTKRYPQTRLGVEQIIRDEFAAARDYQRHWAHWRRTQRGLPPRRDLELDAISEVLQGKRWIHCHSYRQDEILALMRTLEEFDVQIGTFQHILEGYKVADAMARHGAMGSAFSDWWAYKFEVYDAIPYNGALMHNAGVVVSFNSDSRELARHLNQEAGKAVKYGGVPPGEALKFVTLNAARQLRIEQYVGSLAPGKHADLAVWSGPPLENFSRCDETWIDGRKYFDRQEDQKLRAQIRKMRAVLIQKILTSGAEMKKPGEDDDKKDNLWPREDIFCGRHEHGRE